MKLPGADNGFVAFCLTIVGSAVALGGLTIVSQSNLRADLGAEIAINRTDIVEIRSDVKEMRSDLNRLSNRVARIEGSLLAALPVGPNPKGEPLPQ